MGTGKALWLLAVGIHPTGFKLSVHFGEALGFVLAALGAYLGTIQ